jgi:hypothetical protein
MSEAGQAPSGGQEEHKIEVKIFDSNNEEPLEVLCFTGELVDTYTHTELSFRKVVRIVR